MRKRPLASNAAKKSPCSRKIDNRAFRHVNNRTVCDKERRTDPRLKRKWPVSGSALNLSSDMFRLLRLIAI